MMDFLFVLSDGEIVRLGVNGFILLFFIVWGLSSYTSAALTVGSDFLEDVGLGLMFTLLVAVLSLVALFLHYTVGAWLYIGLVAVVLILGGTLLIRYKR